MFVRNKVFISYAHEDRDVAQDLRKHLAARLRAEASVWIDEDIRAGDDWRSTLEAALRSSSCALLLLSADFFYSDYIQTEELKQIQQERERGLRVVPVLVRACSWKHHRGIEPIQFGSRASTPLYLIRERSYSEYEAEIEKVCEIVAGYVGQLAKQSTATTHDSVAELLSRIPDLQITEAKGGGDYAVVYRGVKDGRDVAVKVMTGMRLEELIGPFRDALTLATKLDHQCFVPIIHRRVDPDLPPVWILPWIESKHLLQQTATKSLSVDEVAAFLLRASEALSMLHGLGGVYGVLTPDNVYMEERLEILRFPAISTFGFLSREQSWNKCVGFKAHAATYLIPEQYFGQPISAKSDQYALAQLALEMLCGAAPVTVKVPADLEKKREFFDSPAEFIRERYPGVTWPDDHPQFAEILFRMLKRNPDERWPALSEVVRELRDLEDEARAVARSVFMDLKDDSSFFADFYALFFARCEGARQKFHGLDMAKQHEKLRSSMVGMLNFQDVGEPTTLYPYVAVHRERGVTLDELNEFEKCFVEMLKQRYGASSKKVTAWTQLLPAVMDYMKRSCIAGKS